MERVYTSPTLGDVVKYAVAASGVMPRKAHDRLDETEFDQSMAKTYQKRMQRLAKEDCHLQSTFEDIAKLLTSTLGRYVRCGFRAEQIRELLNDLHESYVSLIKQMGTYMTKADTTRYFLTSYAIEIAVRSAARTWIVMQGYIYAVPQPLEPCWYLPSNVDGDMTTPLAKVMAWAYAACGCRLSTFHDPAGTQDEIGRYERNERAARNWKAGKHLPSLPALVKNLEDSFNAQALIGNPVEQRLQDGIVTCAVIARITTFITQDVQKVFGREFLKETLSQPRLYAGWMAVEIKEYLANLDQHLIEHASEIEPPDESGKKFGLESQASIRMKKRVSLGIKMAPHFWGGFEAKCQTASDLMMEHTDHDGHVPDNVTLWLEKRYGAYAARIRADVISRWRLDKPADLDTYVQRGMVMRNLQNLTLEDVNSFHEELSCASIAGRLPWLVEWLKGIVFYRSADYAASSIYYTQAFKLAKYSAGDLQYPLVNQYLEVMAKTNRWLDFKQGALWASYLDLPVRWLRDREPTDANIRKAFNVLGLSQMQYTRM